MSDIKFVGLHAHSGFSIGDGLSLPKKHFDFALSNGADAMAITDHGNLNAASYMIDAQKEYEKKGIPFKVIFGCEMYIHPSIVDWKNTKDTIQEKKEEDEQKAVVEDENESKSKWFNPINRRHHLVVLAQNYQGLENLFRLISKSYRGDNFYRYPRVDFSLLKQHNEGLIISTACLAGLPSWLALRDYEKGSEQIQKSLDDELSPLLDIFGKDRAFLEIQFNKLPEQRIVNDEIIKFSKSSGYKMIATADSHYPSPDLWRDREIYRLLIAQSRGNGKTIEDLPKTIDELKCELFPKGGDQMFSSFKEMYGDDSFLIEKEVKEAIELTHDIAHNQIGKIKPNSTMKLPNISNDPFSTLKKNCIDSLKLKGLDKNSQYIDRLVKELHVIKEKNFASYFITLQRSLDIIKKQSLMSPCRGSGGGSLVCYLLGITQLDPVKHNLLFERFLSMHREEAPDIDNDVENKDVSLALLKEEFGDNNVLPVSNFVTMQLKSLVKDLSKLYQIPFEEVNEVTKVIDEESKRNIIDDAGGDQKLAEVNYHNVMKHSVTFRTFISKYPKIGEHIDVLYKQNKTIGRHAGGVIICSDADSCMPSIRIGGTAQTPWTEGMAARHLEQWGLIKYDFLGLATLRIIHKCIENILIERGNKNPTMDDVYAFYNAHLHPDSLKEEDEVFTKVYKNGSFPGIFQFSQANVQKFCVAAQPSNIQDISAITSIYRPGPLLSSADKAYVKAKEDESQIVFEHPVLEEILKPTYGCLVYQEQFMLLAHKLAGFSLEESDTLRKLLVKPISSLGDEMKKKREEAGQKFIDGCVANGISQKRAERLWHEEIMGFISYGFNASHALGYAYVSYQCAWLYTHYEKEWLLAYLECDSDRDKAVNDAIAAGYTIGKVDINNSDLKWKIVNNTIYPSLLTVKGIGDTAAEELLEVRKSLDGKFNDLKHFLYQEGFTEKTKKPKLFWRYSKFNKRALEALIKVEAFDSIGAIGTEFSNYKHLYQFISGNYEKLKRGNYDQEDILKSQCNDWNNLEKISIQRDLIGTYSKDLLFTKKALDLLNKHGVVPLSELADHPQKVWFVLRDYKVKQTKSGKDYYQLTISDVDDKQIKFNYFNYQSDEFIKDQIYVGYLFKKDEWINCQKGSSLIKIS